MSDFAEHLQTALGTVYQLDRELTGGGMSRVFVATDQVLGRKVVVKVLPPEFGIFRISTTSDPEASTSNVIQRLTPRTLPRGANVIVWKPKRDTPPP